MAFIDILVDEENNKGWSVRTEHIVSVSWSDVDKTVTIFCDCPFALDSKGKPVSYLTVPEKCVTNHPGRKDDELSYLCTDNLEEIETHMGADVQRVMLCDWQGEEVGNNTTPIVIETGDYPLEINHPQTLRVEGEINL